MTRVLLTGANGHLGANIARSLIRRGHEVVPFVRRGADLRGLDGLELTYRYGDITDVASFSAGAAGCDVIIHAAAVYRLHTPNSKAISVPALTGTTNLYKAAQAAGVKRIIYTSTTFAVGADSDPDCRRTASDWNEAAVMPYSVAKLEAEKLAWRLAEETGIATIVFCPNGILGPYDYRVTPTTGLLRDLINGRGVTMVAGASFVDVRDVADLHAAAVTDGDPGQRYLVTGEAMTLTALGQLVNKLTGAKPRHMPLTGTAAQVMAAVMESGARLLGGEPLLTREMAREIIGQYQYYDCAETVAAFGFEARPAATMIADAVRWLLHINQIKMAIADRLAAQFPADPAWLSSAEQPQMAETNLAN